MSLSSKITLGGAICTGIGIIYYVHAKRQEDNRKMREGVLRDKERQQKRKLENAYLQHPELAKLLNGRNRDEEAILKLLEEEKEKGK